MVAQHRHRSFPQASDEAQGFQGTRPPIDQIAHQPEPVGGRVEGTTIQQASEGVETPLNVADGVSGHYATKTPLAGLRGG